MTVKRRTLRWLCALIFVGELTLAGSLSPQAMRGTIRKQSFGKTNSGGQIDLYSLSNQKGMEVSITNFGATVVTLRVPDRAGKRRTLFWDSTHWKAMRTERVILVRRSEDMRIALGAGHFLLMEDLHAAEE